MCAESTSANRFQIFDLLRQRTGNPTPVVSTTLPPGLEVCNCNPQNLEQTRQAWTKSSSLSWYDLPTLSKFTLGPEKEKPVWSLVLIATFKYWVSNSGNFEAFHVGKRRLQSSLPKWKKHKLILNNTEAAFQSCLTLVTGFAYTHAPPKKNFLPVWQCQTAPWAPNTGQHFCRRTWGQNGSLQKANREAGSINTSQLGLVHRTGIKHQTYCMSRLSVWKTYSL